MQPSELLAAYDAQLRTDAETQGAESVTVHGPLRMATFLGGRGFISYQDLGGADESGIRRLVREARAHFEEMPEVTKVEWKTRGHDQAPGLHEALVEHGFHPEEPESIMIGEAHLLAADVDLPEGVSLRQVSDEAGVRAMVTMQVEVFGDESDEIAPMVASTLRRLEDDAGAELWVAEAGGEVISAGRLDPVEGTDFAGIWGGATREEWRGKGIYRALTSARARSAIRLGKTLINSDSTEFSRPILERSGLVKVSTTTPYEWRR